ncbi:MAG: hypothetical protein K0Q50_993 [Vampirovibrio sp.]|jgi:hypothetical protein|nr:hypothetical protein [Vampirovibrio sp.]
MNAEGVAARPDAGAYQDAAAYQDEAAYPFRLEENHRAVDPLERQIRGDYLAEADCPRKVADEAAQTEQELADAEALACRAHGLQARKAPYVLHGAPQKECF